MLIAACQKAPGKPTSRVLIHRLNSGCPVRGDSRWRKVIFLVVTLRFGPCAKSLFIPEAPIQHLKASTSLSSPFLFLYRFKFCLLRLPFHQYRTCCDRLHQIVIRGWDFAFLAVQQVPFQFSPWPDLGCTSTLVFSTTIAIERHPRLLVLSSQPAQPAICHTAARATSATNLRPESLSIVYRFLHRVRDFLTHRLASYSGLHILGFLQLWMQTMHPRLGV